MVAAALRRRTGALAAWLCALSSLCSLCSGVLRVAPLSEKPAVAALPLPREELNETWHQKWEHRNEADLHTMKTLCKSGPLDVLLLGDSITERWLRPSFSGHIDSPMEYTSAEKVDLAGDLKAAFGPQRRVALAAIGGDKAQDLLWRLRHGGLGEAVRLCAPRAVHVLMGTNDLGFGVGPPEAGESYRQLVDELVALRQGARLTLQLIMPRGFRGVNQSYDDLPQSLKWAACPGSEKPPPLVHGLGEGDSDPGCSLFFSRVSELNRIISSVASELSASGHDVRSLDCNSFLTTDGGIGKDTFPDLLHLNSRGYARWSQCLRSAYP